MKLNFFKKEKTGWELIDLMEYLQNEQSILINYSESYSLSAINLTKDKFVVIRKFAAREYEGKIDMLNTSDKEGGEHYPISQYGMTLVSVSNLGASSYNVILPNSLKYESVELNGETIFINHSDGSTITNFQEINSLWTLENLMEKEILNRFKSLRNLVEESLEIEKHTSANIEDVYFGQLKLNIKLDWYEVIKDGIEFSFNNTTFDQITKNLRNTERLVSALDDIQKTMIQEMLALKNDNWLEDGETELSKEEFQKEIKIYGINTYEDGCSKMFYKANDLFWGHEIQISIDNEQNYKSSTIVG
jgi:hypothetical protein